MPAPKQQIRFCTSHDGERIAYATSGAGPALVKAANWLSHLEFDWGSPVWSPMLTELSRAHTLVRYDERGCGLSDWNIADLSFDAWVRDLENDIDVLAQLSQVSCPTLVLHAVRDARVPFDEGRLIASEIPGARFVPLESRNHLLLETEPAWRRWLDELHAFLPAMHAADSEFSVLTPRELDLLELIAQGCDNAQIAAHLELSEKTVRNHITSIFAKLEVENRARAVVLARNAGFGRQAA